MAIIKYYKSDDGIKYRSIQQRHSYQVYIELQDVVTERKHWEYLKSFTTQKEIDNEMILLQAEELI